MFWMRCKFASEHFWWKSHDNLQLGQGQAPELLIQLFLHLLQDVFLGLRSETEEAEEADINWSEGKSAANSTTKVVAPLNATENVDAAFNVFVVGCYSCQLNTLTDMKVWSMNPIEAILAWQNVKHVQLLSWLVKPKYVVTDQSVITLPVIPC